MKLIKFDPLSSQYRRPLIIFLGLVLLTASFSGLTQQNSSEDANNHGDFDLDTLVDRVSHSRSLGFLTKLSLKKDAERLLKDMHDHHAGISESSLEQLRERYDVMVHKLMILLQDKDNELTKSIDDARDKLWAILSDESKFASI
jgi:hypothetical protein